MSTTITLYVSEQEAFDPRRVREIIVGMPNVDGIRDVGTPSCDFEWRVSSSVDSALAMIVKDGKVINVWAANEAAFNFVSCFTKAYGKALHLIDSSHGIPISVSGTESPTDIRRSVVALDN